jgi:hypothetical protein
MTKTKCTAIAPRIFTGSGALAYLDRHLPDLHAFDWDAALDQLSEEWGWDI